METHEKAETKASTSKQVNRARGRPQHPDRLTITPEALERLNGWSKELETRLRGVTLTRSQLVHWLICSHEPTLSTQEVRQLEEAFFDEIKFAEWALRELKAAQSRGESVTLTEIIGRNRVTRPERNAPQAKPKRSSDRTEKHTENTGDEIVKTRNLLDKSEES